LTSFVASAQSIEISPNGGTTNSSAILDLKSTTKGFLPPRLSSVQRDDITNPTEGLVIYNSTVHCLEVYRGAGWFNLCSKAFILPNYLPQSGLVALYPFNGNANDESGNNYNGRVVGSVPFIADRNGKSNSAIQGGSGYIPTSKDFFRFSRKDSYSVSVWFTVPSYGCSGRLLSTESSEGHLRIVNSGNGGIVVQFGDYLYPTKTSPNKWHHLVYVYDNRNEVVYIDGFANVTNYEQEMSEVLVYNTPFTIGAKASPAYDLWCGNIDDIGVWNRPLSSQEVLKLFNGNKTL
jgi:hypothetical protein